MPRVAKFGTAPIIAERAVALRHAVRFTLRELKERAGVPLATLGGWERRNVRKADPTTVRRVEAAYGIPPRVLGDRLTAAQLATAPGVVTLPATTHRVKFAVGLAMTSTGGVRPTTAGPTIGLALSTAAPSTTYRPIAVWLR